MLNSKFNHLRLTACDDPADLALGARLPRKEESVYEAPEHKRAATLRAFEQTVEVPPPAYVSKSAPLWLSGDYTEAERRIAAYLNQLVNQALDRAASTITITSKADPVVVQTEIAKAIKDSPLGVSPTFLALQVRERFGFGPYQQLYTLTPGPNREWFIRAAKAALSLPEGFTPWFGDVNHPDFKVLDEGSNLVEVWFRAAGHCDQIYRTDKAMAWFWETDHEVPGNLDIVGYRVLNSITTD
jgi:hypothetical protein